MYQGKTIVAFIPARGGSKGLPRKNVRDLGGKPLIGWSIDQAKASGVCDRIIVSTDDPEIADVAKEFGAEVPFMRPPELASDQAKGMDVILHAMDWLSGSGEVYDLVLLLQPTSPLRSPEDIVSALELFFQKNAGAVVSVCESEHSPALMNNLGPDLSLKDFLKEGVQTQNRQEFKTFYRLNGAVYLAGWDYVKKTGSFMGDKSFAYIMPRERSVDIDTELDLKFTGFLLQERKERPTFQKNRKENDHVQTE